MDALPRESESTDRGTPVAPADSGGSDLGSITAVICNYNGEAYLSRCVEALRRQDRPLDEIVVVDNASTDGSLELLAREFPDVRVVHAGGNLGAAEGRNVALREARGEWVLLVDNDAMLDPDVLGKLESAALADPKAVVLQPRSVFASEPERVHYDGGEFHYAGLFALRNFYTLRTEAVGEGTVEVPGAVSVALLCRRELLIELGGFDERYFILFEDLDLSYRLRLAGHRILSVEDAICHHDAGTAGISFRAGNYPKRRAWLHARNRWWYLYENYSWRTLILTSPGIALYECVWLLFTLRSGTLGSHLSGKWACLRGWGESRRKRRRVQALRVRPDRELLVGGPMTVSPNLRQGGPVGWALAFLDGGLRAWWWLVRRACG